LETAVKKLYEGMFLIDSAEAAKDWDGINDFITKILTKAEAEIVSIRKWDERPLAYPIKRVVRGTYILVYFKVNGPKVHDIERDVLLSERIMRVMILKGDHLTEADLAKETPAMRAERPVSQPEAEVAVAATEAVAAVEEPEEMGEDVVENNPETQGA
jgi:small subunit ribosomal protein S6